MSKLAVKSVSKSGDPSKTYTLVIGAGGSGKVNGVQACFDTPLTEYSHKIITSPGDNSLNRSFTDSIRPSSQFDQWKEKMNKTRSKIHHQKSVLLIAVAKILRKLPLSPKKKLNYTINMEF